MPDRYEQERNKLVKAGVPYAEAQKQKEPVPEVSETTEAVKPPVSAIKAAAKKLLGKK